LPKIKCITDAHDINNSIKETKNGCGFLFGRYKVSSLVKIEFFTNESD
jgi:hypothetical protein